MNELSLTQTFLAVYRMASVTRAADHLGITQPGASGHIRTLESRLGKTLFEKKGRGLAPTAAADDLARSIGPHLDAIETALLSAKMSGEALPGTVHFGGPAEFLSTMICPLLRRPLGERIHVQMRLGQAREIVGALADGALDLAVSTLRIRSPAVTYTPLYREQFVLIGSAALLRDMQDDRTKAQRLERINAQPIIAYAADLPILRRYWRDIFNLDISAEPELVIPDLRAVVAAVASGLGISVVPHYLCRKEIQSGALSVLIDDQGRCSNELLLGANRYAANRPRVAFLRNHILATFSEVRDDLTQHAQSGNRR